jgi:hypothetical protein
MSDFGTRKTATLNLTSSLDPATEDLLLAMFKTIDPNTEEGMLIQTCDNLASFAIGYARQLLLRITATDPLAAIDNDSPSRIAMVHTVQSSVDMLLVEQAAKMAKVPRLKKAATQLWKKISVEYASDEIRAEAKAHGIDVARMMQDISMMQIKDKTADQASPDLLKKAYQVYDLLTAEVAGSC